MLANQILQVPTLRSKRRRRSEWTLCRLPGRIKARDAAEGRRPANAMLTEAARGIATGIKAGDDLAVQVDDLRLGVDADAGIRVVNARRMPCGVERRRDLKRRYAVNINRSASKALSNFGNC